MEDKLTQDNFYSTSSAANELDIGKLLRFLLMQSKLIISIVLIVFVLSYAHYFFSTKKYQIQSLIQYEAFDQNIFDPTRALQIQPATSSSDILNMLELYESRTNYLKVIKDLKLYLDIKDLGNDETIDIHVTANNDNLGKEDLKFSFSENSYSLLNEDLNVLQTAKYGENIITNDHNITVKSASLINDRPIDIKFTNPEKMYKAFKKRMDVKAIVGRNSFFRNDGLITVSYVTDDINLGKEIINYANSSFLNQRINDESEKSRRAINFIDENIETIEKSVVKSKLKLKKFREKNKSIDVDLEIQGIINKVQVLEEALSSINIELAKAEEIYTANNPVYNKLLNEKITIENQREAVIAEIEMMPKEQQEYIDLYNELEVSQTLFEELESRRLGFSILEASTIGDIRIIDEAYVESQVSPQIILVILLTLLSFVIACIVAIIRGFNFLPISNPAEIFDNGIHLPIIGVIPFTENIEFSGDDIRLNTSIESLIVNINSLQNDELDKKIITITSPSPSNGKSTVSMKLAEGFAKIGKKVLLVDNDLKRGNIASNYNLRSINEKVFDSINEATIKNYQVNGGFYLVPRVKGLKNSFEFLYSPKYKEKINFFKDYFDFVIFDTGPLLSVSDSSVLIEKSDLNLLVVRHGINRINEIKQSVENLKQINKEVDGLVYNSYAKPKSYYGYYGIYGNYSYQYYAEKYLDETYDYEKKD